MIRQYKYLNLWKAVCYFKGRYQFAVMPKKHEAWQELIEIVAIKAKVQS